MESSISDLLNELQHIRECDQESLDKWCNKLCDFYRQNPRHSYSEITEYIISSDGGVEYMEKILPILGNIRDSLRKEKNDVYKNVGKMIDHIQLEIVRIKYISEIMTQSVKDAFIEMNNDQIDGFESLQFKMQGDLDDLERKSQELSKSIEQNLVNQDKINSKVEELNSTADLAAQKVENAQTEIITILGIFASIVLAFVSGIAFSTSVLQNISSVSIYKLTFVSCGIVLVLVNIIYMLLRFVMEIRNFRKEIILYPRWMIWLDISISIVAIIMVIMWLVDIKYLAKLFQDYLYGL